MKPVKAEPKVANPQSKADIAETHPANQSFGGFQPEAPPVHAPSQSYNQNQQQINQTSAPSVANHTDYTDEVEKQAVEEENSLDAEAEKDLAGLHEEHHEELYEGDESQKKPEFGDLSNPSNPLFGKYDVPASSKKSVFCPPCGKMLFIVMFCRY